MMSDDWMQRTKLMLGDEAVEKLGRAHVAAVLSWL